MNPCGTCDTADPRTSEAARSATSRPPVGRWRAMNCLVNLSGNYDYLSEAYYVSQGYENNGEVTFPTCKQMLDAYIPPLFLEKARLEHVAIPEYYISNGYFEPPAAVDPINPFTLKGRIIRAPALARAAARSLTRNYTYAVCCQELPPGSHVRYFRSVLGWCSNERYRPASMLIWRTFGIPLGRVRVVELASGELLLSDIAPLPLESLRFRERRYVKEQIEWVS